MPWPSTLSDGQLVTTAWLNAVASASAVWQGQVNANGQDVVNLNKLTANEIYPTKIGIGTATPERHIHLKDGYPEILIENSLAAPGNRKWRFSTNYGQKSFSLDIVTDDISAAGGVLNIYRDGQTVTKITMPDGLVGIGTNEPGAKLDVAGTAQIIAVHLSQYGAAKAKWYHDSGAGATYLSSEGWSKIHLMTNGLSRLCVDGGGYVGIGTQYPQRNLHLAAATPEVMIEHSSAPLDQKKWRFITGGEWFGIDTVNDAITAAQMALMAYRSGVNVTRVCAPNGKFGIGTQDPQRKLHVVSSESAPVVLQSTTTDCYMWLWSNGASNSISMDGGGAIYIGGDGQNRNVNIRNCDGGWGLQAKFEGSTKRVYFYGLPSSSAGLSSGAIWYDPNDGNRLKYVP